ncbi:hypothetical protein [Oceanobacillus chungangensis]|uniref:DUF4352 domain-containing protein n=1 Tax=Oceanobacillus chungangensis TaxID=1229152 RepID=A0A3D8Q2L2_9BACI|nr:hypothetical protein [Oceanobacillus chungangensis]RDW21719.1 hypothetical protein CWR45_02270 [Oceanobacillus chungangensis]
MKKILTLLTILIATTLFLSACGDEKEPTADTTPTESQDNTGEDSATEEPVEDTEKGTDSTQEDDSNTGEDSATSKNDLNINTKDQLDLKIGDTGKFDTTIGQFEITLDNAKLITDGLDGEVSQLDDLILLDITIKNTSGKTMLLEEILQSTVVKDDLESTGTSNGAEYFDSVEELKGEIADGEEISGQFITDVYESEEYYLAQESGAIAAGTTNQVIWTIPVSEIQ